MFAQSKTCRASETAVASERFWNNIRFWATDAKQTTEKRPFLDSISLVMQKLYYKNKRDVFSTWSVPRCYKRDEV
jgi:hypothetical protein